MYDQENDAKMEAGISSLGRSLLNTTTQRSRLALIIKESDRRAGAAREALDILERNPDLERLLDLLSKI